MVYLPVNMPVNTNMSADVHQPFQIAIVKAKILCKITKKCCNGAIIIKKQLSLQCKF